MNTLQDYKIPVSFPKIQQMISKIVYMDEEELQWGS